MTYQYVRYTKEKSIGDLVLQRPEAQNAINLPMVEDIARIMDEISDDGEVKVLIVTGAGKDFSIGTDMYEVLDPDHRAEIIDRLTIGPLFHKFDRPIIAAVNGNALGQGLELALACDLRFCGENSRFGLPQVIHGEIPWDGGTQRLSRLVGRGKAMEMILTGGTIDAQEAFRIGLVNRVVSVEGLMDEVMATAKAIADRAPIALRYVKEAIKEGMELTLEQGLRLEGDLYFLLHATKDRTEGITAFREKRPARFEGK